MKHAFKVFALIGCILAVTGGSACAYIFELGSGSSINTSATNDALRLDVVQINPNLDSVSFDLAVGQTSAPFFFARIGTTETWINADDRQPRPVTAVVDFDTPNVSPSIDGTSVGFSALWHFVQGWNLEWEDPVRVLYNGLDFSVDLSNANHLTWFWKGPDGTADIYATVTLNAVPVPAPLLLLGTSLVGMVLVRRRMS